MHDLRPNWRKWKDIRYVYLWQAVALWANIDPKFVHYSGGRIENFPPAYEGWTVAGVPASVEFMDRMEIATGNIGELMRSMQWPEMSRPAFNKLPMAEFAAFALSLDGWEIPPELAALAEPDKRDAEILILKQQVEALALERDKLRVEVHGLTDQLQTANEIPDERSVRTYLNIIGALLKSMLGKTPAGKPKSVFQDQSKIIEDLVAYNEGRQGIAERTLQEKFAQANRTLSES